jgi:hypothetical protein
MAGQDNLHIAREMSAAWNAHDVEAFLKRLDTKTTWESDAFPAPLAGHEGARQFFKVYVTAFPICISISSRSLPPATAM